MIEMIEMSDPLSDFDSVRAPEELLDEPISLLDAPAADSVAGAAMVNRTRRVVRERARSRQIRTRRVRSLYIPLAVCAGLLAAVVFAFWSMLEGYDTTSTGLPDSSQQIMVLVMWCLPVSAALLAAVWMRRAGTRFDNGTGDGRPQ